MWQKNFLQFINYKKYNTCKKGYCNYKKSSFLLTLIFIIICFTSFSMQAFALDEVEHNDYDYNNNSHNDNFFQNSEPIYEDTLPVYEETFSTEYIEPTLTTTEPYFENSTTTEYIEDFTYEETTTEPLEIMQATEEDTQIYEPETTKKSYIDYFAGIFETTQSPTQLSTSTVSTNTYSTNNNAGIVCWVCVIVGVLTLVVMLASTKLSGNEI